MPVFDAAPARSARSGERPKVYDDVESISYADEAPSSFDFSPPFKPRRNWARLGTYLAVVFAVVTLGAAAAIALNGVPDWVPIPRPTFAEAQRDLQLDFPRNRQDKRTLPNGTEFFGASGTVTNIGQQTRNVPTILIVLRDARDRVVYSWEVAPPKRTLKPGESVTINEAVTDVPKSAVAAEIGWKPD
ncbi:thioredoxin [Novosphingobium sp. PC22D]|uniref:thioredoxin n=1 Tax=Novosphingobium sp. PC22D TaxID=1962403 RepID=UPI0026C8E49C